MRSYTKTIRWDSIALWRNYHRLSNQKIVCVFGKFDVIDRSIIETLMRAKKGNDVLLAAVRSDASFDPEKQPVMSQEDRAFYLAALECVDFVVVTDCEDAQEFMRLTDLHELREPTVEGAPARRTVFRDAKAQEQESEVLAGNLSQRADDDAEDGGGCEGQEISDEAGSILRSPSSRHSAS